ncbi:MAG: DEAD/DEAH box helicase [Candidatus Hydrogenedentes bacterium]|nr:DEAD/DEAH box helicase [Candidatus Hydrogenedentota bacterium]
MENPIGEAAHTRISGNAAASMRREIDAAGGQEVFFAGALDSAGIVERVRVCARGNEGAVPAIFDSLDARDVVIHNHPGGDLRPSDADLDLGVVYSHNGHGVFIIDNEATRVYVLVEPFLPKDLHSLAAEELADHIGPDSAIAKALPDFEVRPQQEQMMNAIARAFNTESIAVIEAPTGVGKTLAYLLPAVLWAVRNRERVVISTRTINLQEQIVFKDIPLLRKCLPDDFSAVLVKGRSNYVCLKRLERAITEATLFDDQTERDALKAISEWAEHTEDGSKSDLSFVPPREVWERVCSEADTCTAAQCQYAGNCFVTKARREIAKADLVVVNHHMLFSDLAIKKEMGSFTSLAVLPAFYRLILDEAHRIEESATEYFGVDVTRNGTLALLGRFLRQERGQERGLLPYLKLKLIQDTDSATEAEVGKILTLIEETIVPLILALREKVRVTFDAIRKLAADRCGQIGRDIKWRLTAGALADPELRDLHGVHVVATAEALGQLAQHCTTLGNLVERITPKDATEHPLSMEIAQIYGYRDRVLRAASALAESTSAELAENTVRWIEIDAKNNSIVRLIRCPLEVGKPLAEWVYPNLKTVVMTSATLSVGQSFDFFSQRVGLDRIEEDEIEFALLDSPFDFEKQAVVCVPNDMPPPDDARYMETSIDCIQETLSITGGSAFILFTSFYALNLTHARLKDALNSKGITTLTQGSDTRTRLLERFRNDSSSVLFATDSFWEGVDVPGESLRCVILPKLPFPVPTEPLLQARAEAIEAAGGNAFMDYTVPLAVIRFRQGFGRLIRRRSDRGSVVLLDSRVLSKQYGKRFLKSLPPAPIIVGDRNETMDALREFHGKQVR